jgi:hypothetical protein
MPWTSSEISESDTDSRCAIRDACHLDRRTGRFGPEWRDLNAGESSSAARCFDGVYPESTAALSPFGGSEEQHAESGDQRL